jgi:hypothetical protein
MGCYGFGSALLTVAVQANQQWQLSAVRPMEPKHWPCRGLLQQDPAVGRRDERAAHAPDTVVSASR